MDAEENEDTRTRCGLAPGPSCIGCYSQGTCGTDNTIDFSDDDDGNMEVF